MTLKDKASLQGYHILPRPCHDGPKRQKSGGDTTLLQPEWENVTSVRLYTLVRPRIVEFAGSC